jgi:heme-degrading monooxygenase HmoA
MTARYVSLWEFTVQPEKRAEFLHFYGAGGVWAQLFAKAEGYLGTVLLSDRSDSLRYVTLDRWRTKEDHDAFMARFGEAYTELDKRCEQLTAKERHLGSYSECGESDIT